MLFLSLKMKFNSYRRRKTHSADFLRLQKLNFGEGHYDWLSAIMEIASPKWSAIGAAKIAKDGNEERGLEEIIQSIGPPLPLQPPNRTSVTAIGFCFFLKP